MKRLTFKKEHQNPVKAETKTGTARWSDQKLHVGEVVAAVVGKNGKPAFLTPANEAFAYLRITKANAMFWKDFGDEHLSKTGVTRDWYLKERPCANDLDRIFYYEWEVTSQ